MKLAVFGLLLILSGAALGLHPGASPAAASGSPAAAGGNNAPVCIAFGPSFVACNEDIVLVPLDGSRSFDPDDDPLTFEWQVGCPGTTLEDPTASQTNLIVDTSQLCGTQCSVRLRVRDGQALTVCRVTITFDELVFPLDIQPGSCPNPIPIGADDDDDDDDDGDDDDDQGDDDDDHGDDDDDQGDDDDDHGDDDDDQGDDDDDGAPQTLTGGGSALFGGLFISLTGDKDWDPQDVQPETLRLGRAGVENFLGATVSPVSVFVSDDMTPFRPKDNCECAATGPDGVQDLGMLFDLQEVIDVLGLAGEPPGASVELRIQGVLVTGELAIADDCVLITAN